MKPLHSLLEPPLPKAVTGHIKFTDLNGQLGVESPLWVSLVRDVVEREAAEFAGRRALRPQEHQFLREMVAMKGFKVRGILCRFFSRFGTRRQ